MEPHKHPAFPFWQTWIKSYATEERASAGAIQVLNRWAKTADPARRALVYALKERWIAANQRYLTVGQRVRDEFNLFDGQYDRTLYLHWFDVEGMAFSLHSYVEPSMLIEEAGHDEPPSHWQEPSDRRGERRPAYGHALKKREMSKLSVSLPQLMRGLEFYLSERELSEKEACCS